MLCPRHPPRHARLPSGKRCSLVGPETSLTDRSNGDAATACADHRNDCTRSPSGPTPVTAPTAAAASHAAHPATPRGCSRIPAPRPTGCPSASPACRTAGPATRPRPVLPATNSLGPSSAPASAIFFGNYIAECPKASACRSAPTLSPSRHVPDARARFPALRMLIAAFRSRSTLNPHLQQRNTRLFEAPLRCPHAWHSRDMYAGLTATNSRPAHSALYRSCSRKIPHVCANMLRFKPAFARTFRPGSCAVPRAEAVMFRIPSASTLITPNRRTIRVLAR